MIDAMGAAPVNMNATYEAAQTKAYAAKFEQELKKAQQDTKVAAGNATAKDAKLRDACQGFEEMFMEMMYKEMRNTVPDDALLGNSNADKIWQSMMDSEMMKSATKGGGVGLADMLYRQLSPQGTTNAAVKK
jgi:peptidoglycan hydrolase FlgJ